MHSYVLVWVLPLFSCSCFSISNPHFLSFFSCSLAQKCTYRSLSSLLRSFRVSRCLAVSLSRCLSLSSHWRWPSLLELYEIGLPIMDYTSSFLGWSLFPVLIPPYARSLYGYPLFPYPVYWCSYKQLTNRTPSPPHTIYRGTYLPLRYTGVCLDWYSCSLLLCSASLCLLRPRRIRWMRP